VKPTNQIVIYEGADVRVEVRLDGESVWLTQEQMGLLFGRERSVITKHIRNVFAEGELDEEGNVQNLHIAGSDKPVKFYNLDVIISVGYRVKSIQGTRFRQWATRVLREHLTQGYSLDRERFDKNAAELEAALQLVRKAAAGEALTAEQGRGLADVIARYTQTFLWLQRYDEGLLTAPEGTAGGVLPTLDEAQAALARLKADLMARGEASEGNRAEGAGQRERHAGGRLQPVADLQTADPAAVPYQRATGHLGRRRGHRPRFSEPIHRVKRKPASGGFSLCYFLLRPVQTRSNTAAMPCPPPMHIVTSA
jgi:hypothetical protein